MKEEDQAKAITKEEERMLLWKMGYSTIQELETDQGILASGRNEIYGCIFGRDSLITALELLTAYDGAEDPYFLALVKKILLNLVPLQGKTVNIESGEEPGKCIHEFRAANHERLTKLELFPWYVYPDNAMRNYDTVDATPLFLIAVHEYLYRASADGDAAFSAKIFPAVRAALDWLLLYGDKNDDGLIDYRFHPDRKHGGLRTQSWMDSIESLFHADSLPVAYPVAPIEVQAYAYVAFRAWSERFSISEPELAHKLSMRADGLKKLFNEKFVLEDERGFDMAFAIDGAGKQLTAARSSMGHCLWAAYARADGSLDTVLDAEYIPKLAARLMTDDLFEPEAGIRTLSSRSPRFDPQSYHNGSIWPHDTAIVAEGLAKFGFADEAARVRTGLLRAYAHFNTPLELFVYDKGDYGEYASANGQGACRKQAWSAAALLAASANGRAEAKEKSPAATLDLLPHEHVAP